ncbi:MAG: M28 family metallopeptidase [Methanoregulaceae archaeon]|nr:M28 family metallopeptidase [Methanoregulaceae archaeon]
MNPIPDLTQQVSPDRLRQVVQKLSSYNTRNTLSETLKEAAAWLAEEYRKIEGVEAELMEYTLPRGRRVPEDRKVLQVVATTKGTTDHWVGVGGHLDSLNLSVDAATGFAPGANDDASGVALALEMARAIAPLKLAHNGVYVGFTGEEQGLHGARALAKRFKSEARALDAFLNNDTVGSSSNKAGQKDDGRVRVFSDESTVENPNTGSRDLARFIEWITRDRVEKFGIKLVFRKDRFGRGGDHTPFHEEGYSAVRFIEVHEEYSRQHTPDDLIEHMDFNYLANVARMNLLAMASLMQAGPAPTDVRIVRDQGHDTTVTWKATPGTCYTVYWRETISPTWQDCTHVEETDKATIKLVNKDDHIFAVGAVGGIPVEAR